MKPTAWRIAATFIVALALVAAPAPARAAEIDLSGTWTGTISGAVTGTATLTIVDTGDSGTISGSLVTDLGTFDFSGTFVQSGRRIVGEIGLTGGTTLRFAGRSNLIGENLRWHFLLPGQGRVDIELTAQ